MVRLDPPLPVLTPFGPGMAHFVIDPGQEHHLQWIVFIDANGECRTVINAEIRLRGNETMGRPEPQ